MKRLLKILALLVIVPVLGVVGLFAVTFMGRRPLADGQIVNGMTVVADGFSSVAVIRSSRPVGTGTGSPPVRS